MAILKLALPSLVYLSLSFIDGLQKQFVICGEIKSNQQADQLALKL